MLRLEARPKPSCAMLVISPLIALLATVLFGALMFAVLGKNPIDGLALFFVEPLNTCPRIPLPRPARREASLRRSRPGRRGSSGRFALVVPHGAG